MTTLARTIRWLLFGSTAEGFFTPAERQRLVEAIRAAEARTSGEVRLHIEPRCPPAAAGAAAAPAPGTAAPGPPAGVEDAALQRALFLFHRFGMTATTQRNGVLLYVALKDRRFAIYGDEGIHTTVGQDFWKAIRDGIAARFSDGLFTDGLAEAIGRIGDTLAEQFPPREGDVNELPDEMSFSSGDEGGDEEH